VLFLRSVAEADPGAWHLGGGLRVVKLPARTPVAGKPWKIPAPALDFGPNARHTLRYTLVITQV